MEKKMDELINCTYEQWELWACHNPPVCANAYEFISCGSYFEIFLIALITGSIIFLVIYLFSKTKRGGKR